MQNKTFKHFISWLLIASPLWWSTGCYSTREFIKQDEPGECNVCVVTKGGRSLELSEASFDSRGSVCGVVLKEASAPSASANTASREKARLTLPLDSLRNSTFSDVTVLTKSGQTLEFDTLMLDGRGILSGSFLVYGQSLNNGHKLVTGRDHASLRLNDVQSITTETFSTTKTLLFTGSIIAGACVAIISYIRNNFFRFNGGSPFGKMPGA